MIWSTSLAFVIVGLTVGQTLVVFSVLLSAESGAQKAIETLITEVELVKL
jgi:hypothetical protein